MSKHIHLYQLLSDDEKQMLKDTPHGEEYSEAYKKLRRKHFPKMNKEFSKLHVDNQRRLRELFTIVERVVESIQDSGDVWTSDFRKLADSLSCLDDFIAGDIGYIQEGKPE
jgi:oligoendopeptidase F